MRAIDADALQLAIVEEGQANKRKKYIVGDIWELTGAEIREVINSQPTIHSEISMEQIKIWLDAWEGYIDKDIIERMKYRVIDIPLVNVKEMTE